MVEQIGDAVKMAVGSILPFFLYEAEVDEYPYGVYLYTPEYFSTKDGVYKIATDLTLQVYSNDSDEAFAKAGEAKAALLAGMTGKFFARHSTTSKECIEGVWKVENVFRIIQIS